MTPTRKNIKIRKDDPVAEQLASPKFRAQVKPSKKVYKRTVQKNMARYALKEGKDPMSASPQRNAGPNMLSLTGNLYSGAQARV